MSEATKKQKNTSIYIEAFLKNFFKSINVYKCSEFVFFLTIVSLTLASILTISLYNKYF